MLHSFAQKPSCHKPRSGARPQVHLIDYKTFLTVLWSAKVLLSWMDVGVFSGLGFRV